MHGHYWSDLAGPFLAGAGTAFAFSPVPIAGLVGVAEHEAGLASGLLNTAQQLAQFVGMVLNGLALRVAGEDPTDVDSLLRLLHDALAPAK